MESPAVPVANFTYPPLSKDEIRLARVRKNSVQLITVQWPPSISYEALSYVWGESTIRHKILVSADGGRRRPYRVTKNLYEALWHLSDHHRERVLWIDALCIDQGNVEEKEQQVRNMGRIYQRAHNVCVWLGFGSPEDSRAMAAVPGLLQSIEDDVQSPGLQSEWAMFGRLLQNDWFTRRWVVQEIALAKKATVHCGYREVPWLDFSDAISLYSSNKPLWHGSEKTESPDVVGRGAMSLSFLSYNALRKDSQGNILERRWSVEDLLALLPMFHAQVPHDAVFAILSVASDSSEFTDVDYSLSPAELFTRVFKKIASSSRSLDMMFRPWAPEIPGGGTLPSFIAPASRHSHIRDASGRYTRRNADSLVGAPKRPIYAATPHAEKSPVVAGTLPGFEEWYMPRLSEQLHPSQGSKKAPILQARGVVCAVISELGDVCEDGIIPSNWLSAWRDARLRGDMPDLWRVVVAGRSHDGTAAPNWFRRAFMNLFGSRPGTDDGSINLPDKIESRPPSNLTDYLSRVSACVWGRRFLVSTRDRPGYYGLVPSGAQPGDMICLLEGCSVPVIVRGKPVTELLLRILQLSPLAHGEALLPATEGNLVSTMQYGVSLLLSECLTACEDRLGQLRASLPEDAFHLDSTEESLESSVQDWRTEQSYHEVFSGSDIGFDPDEEKWAAHFQRLLGGSFLESLQRELKESVDAVLQRLSEQAGDEMLQTALTTFFDRLANEALLSEPTSSTAISDDLSWAGVSVLRHFQPLFAGACARAFETKWKWKVEEVLRPRDALPKHASPHLKELVARNRAFQAVLDEVWPAAWAAVWASTKPRVARFWSGEIDRQVWSKPLQDGLTKWTDYWLSDGDAYVGEVVGECYVQGMMDGEWWSVDETRTQPTRLFVFE
jgi:hypothetical protein